jgi:hypothetical protein
MEQQVRLKRNAQAIYPARLTILALQPAARASNVVRALLHVDRSVCVRPLTQEDPFIHALVARQHGSAREGVCFRRASRIALSRSHV